MKYQVWCGEKLLADQDRPGYRMSSGKLKMKVSNAGSLSLKLEARNPTVDHIELIHSPITVTRNEDPIWAGRCVQIERDTYWSPSVSVDGRLACLQDSLLDPMTLGGTPFDVVNQILTAHNQTTGPYQRFSLGRPPADLAWVNIETKNYTTAWAMIQTLLKNYGGYILPRLNLNGQFNGIDWDKSLGRKGSQPVVLGKNLISFTRRIVAKDLYTGLIPTSEYTTLDENGREVKNTLDLSGYANYGYTRTDLGDPRMYIARSNDMRIYRQKQLDIGGSSNATVLAGQAEADLLKGSQVLVEWDVRAWDLSHSNNGYDPFELGKSYQVKAAPFGIDEWLPMTEIDIDLVSPQKSTHVLGGTRPFISRMLRAN